MRTPNSIIAVDHAGQELWRADVGSRLHEGGWGSAASVVLAVVTVLVMGAVERLRIRSMGSF